jgi:predicted nucleic acid-binding protein
MAMNVFLDTSVLLAGLVDFGPQSAPAQSLLHAVAEKTLPSARTAWHCCLEFLLKSAAQDETAGGRIYDAHIAEVARAAGAEVIVTDNRRHFIASLRHGIRVETPSEFLVAMKKGRV